MGKELYVMKKFLVSLFLLISILCYPQEFQIETSQGTKTLIIPEGKTVEEVLVEIAELYWKERYDLEALQEDHLELIQKIEQYKNSINELEQKVQSLIRDQDDLINLYEKKERRSNFKFIPLLGVGFNNKDLSGKLGIGLFLFDKILVQLELSLPYELSIMFGYKLFF